jgi:DNA polymerase-3 subunit delta
LGGADLSGYGVSVYGEERVDLGSVVAAARSPGMFAARRVVLVRDVGALEGEPGAISDYAASPPPDSYLIVRAPSLDLRRKLHKALAQAGRLLRFEAAPPEETGRLSAEVKSLAGEAGVRLEPRAAAFLAEVCGGDLYRVAAELDKLGAWVGGEERRVSLDDVREIAVGSGLLSGWAVGDAVMLRDRSAALTALRRLIETGEEPIRIVGGLAFRARSMLRAKAMLATGARQGDAIGAARAWPYREKLERGLELYTLDELLGFPAALLEADRTLKSRSLAPLAVLEVLVERMIGASAPRGE